MVHIDDYRYHYHHEHAGRVHDTPVVENGCNDVDIDDEASDTTSVLLGQLVDDDYDDQSSYSSSSGSSSSSSFDEEDMRKWCDETICTTTLQNASLSRPGAFVFEGIPGTKSRNSTRLGTTKTKSKANQTKANTKGFLGEEEANDLLEQLDKEQLVYMLQSLLANNGGGDIPKDANEAAKLIEKPVPGPPPQVKAPEGLQYAKVVEYQPIIPPWHKDSPSTKTNDDDHDHDRNSQRTLSKNSMPPLKRVPSSTTATSATGSCTKATVVSSSKQSNNGEEEPHDNDDYNDDPNKTTKSYHTTTTLPHHYQQQQQQKNDFIQHWQENHDLLTSVAPKKKKKRRGFLSSIIRLQNQKQRPSFFSRMYSNSFKTGTTNKDNNKPDSGDFFGYSGSNSRV